MDFDPNSEPIPEICPPGAYVGVVEWAGIKDKVAGKRILVRIKPVLDGTNAPVPAVIEPILTGFAARGDSKQMFWLRQFCVAARVSHRFDTEVEAEVKDALEGCVICFRVVHKADNLGTMRAEASNFMAPTEAQVEAVREAFQERGAPGDDDVPF